MMRLGRGGGVLFHVESSFSWVCFWFLEVLLLFYVRDCICNVFFDFSWRGLVVELCDSYHCLSMCVTFRMLPRC